MLRIMRASVPAEQDLAHSFKTRQSVFATGRGSEGQDTETGSTLTPALKIGPILELKKTPTSV